MCKFYCIKQYATKSTEKILLLLLSPTVYRHIVCFSSHPCLCIVLWKVISPSFSRPSSAPMSCKCIHCTLITQCLELDFV